MTAQFGPKTRPFPPTERGVAWPRSRIPKQLRMAWLPASPAVVDQIRYESAALEICVKRLTPQRSAPALLPRPTSGASKLGHLRSVICAMCKVNVEMRSETPSAWCVGVNGDADTQTVELSRSFAVAPNKPTSAISKYGPRASSCRSLDDTETPRRFENHAFLWRKVWFRGSMPSA